MRLNSFSIDVETQYLAHQSHPEQDHYLFAYTITIKNQSHESAQLFTRAWEITDGNGDITEVHGVGVVGQQPVIAPGEQFTYTSSTVLQTPVGTMGGAYTFKSESGVFDVPIPLFSLAIPGVMN